MVGLMPWLPLILLSIWPSVGQTVTVTSNQLAWPVAFSQPWALINSSFGPRLQASKNNRYDFHRGIDILGTTADPVLAMADGEIITMYAEDDPESTYLTSGNVIVLRHTWLTPYRFHKQNLTTYYTHYLHLDRFSDGLAVGTSVSQGDILGYIGSTGDTEVEHLHFEVRLGTSCSLESNCNTTGFDPHVNPLLFLDYPQTNTVKLRLRKSGKQLRARIKIPGDEQDFNRIKITAENRRGRVMASQIINFNSRVGLDPSSTATLDSATYDDVTIVPQSFSQSTKYKTIRFDVKKVFTSQVHSVTVTLTDIHGQRLKQRHLKKNRIKHS